MSRGSRFLILLALLSACERPGSDSAPGHALAARALPGTLAYPQSSLVTASSGPQVAQMAFTSPAEVDVIAAWYREALPRNGWRLKGDAKDRTRTVTIYAEKGQRPLWITLRPNVGGAGTSYTLVGVFGTDSTKADSGR